MFFQFSPVRKARKTVKNEKQKEAEEAAVLSLAPFTANPKLSFDDVRVGTEAVRELIIKNPCPQDVRLFLTRVPPPENNVAFSWGEALIKSQEETVLRITWAPTAVSASREIITLEDGKRIKKDIPIAFKSVEIKNKKCGKTKNMGQPTFVSKKVRSPTKRLMKSPKINKKSPSSKSTVPTITVTSPCKCQQFIFGSNILPLRPLNNDLPILPEALRRDTFTIKANKLLSEEKENHFDDSLEALSPNKTYKPLLTPLRPSNFLNDSSVRFTSPSQDVTDFSFKTYVINRPNNTTSNLTYTKDASICSSKLSEFAPCLFSSPTQMMAEDGSVKKRKSPAVEESVNCWSGTTFVPRKRFKSILNATKSVVPTSDPSLLAATNAVDPFMLVDSHHSSQWLEEQEERFKKLLNALLTIPSELESEAVRPLDVAAMWRECKRKEVAAAPTKEAVSSRYHTSKRLDALRTAAANLYRSKELVDVLRKTTALVELEKLAIRKDKDVHLDLAIQSTIMSFLLSYNPLWLRIGLETIYNTTIPLRSNSDIMGLSQFLLARFFKDPILISKHKTALSNKYADSIKKFILKKYLMLVYFLDQAKTKKLIKHDPCLFCKNAPIKESREMLLQFSNELICAIGDVTKFLKRSGYTVSYHQTCIDEFDYAVNNLGTDLRDGVRLTKIVEIILLEENLTRELRVPAVSRLQKIHNVDMAFKALERAGFVIMSDIDPRNIVDGHREKTLSLLWQILYKFEAPLLIKSADTIRTWWRSLAVVVKRRVLARRRAVLNRAASKIQNWYRRLRLSRNILRFVPVVQEYLYQMKREKAAVKIQSCYRMWKQRRKYAQIKKSIVLIQRHSRKYLLKRRENAALVIQHFFRGLLVRKRYFKLKATVLFVEQKRIAKQLARLQYKSYQTLRATTVYVQRRFRAKQQRQHYLKLKMAALCVQRRYRALRLMKKEREAYLKLKWAAMVVQNRFRANRAMKLQKILYSRLLGAVIYAQSKFRAKRVRSDYLKTQNAAIVMQRWVRARQQRMRYVKLRSACVVLQRHWRVKCARRHYLRLKNAAVVIQRRLRANKSAKEAREAYVTLKSATVKIQLWYRGVLLMRRERNEFLRLRECAVVVQRRYRAVRVRKNYLVARERVVCLQRRVRATLLMRKERNKFLRLKKAAMTIQQRYRALQAMRTDRESYVQLKRCVVIVQTRYRALKLMEIERLRFLRLKEAAVTIQRHYRALQEMRKARDSYVQLKHCVIVVQRKYRALKSMQKERLQFLTLKRAVLCFEERYIALRLMRQEHKNYLNMKGAAVVIQKRYKALCAMKTERKRFVCLKRAAIVIQKHYRAFCIRKNYLVTRASVVYLQRKLRATLLMRKERKAFLLQKEAAVTIQRRYRALQTMRKARDSYVQLKHYAVVVQRRYRALKWMQEERLRFLALKRAVLCVEERYIALLLMRQQYKSYQNMKRAAVVIQRWYKAVCLMKTERKRFISLKLATIVIQKHYRAVRIRKDYSVTRARVICLQRKLRATLLMRKERNAFLRLKEAAVKIQRRYRALQAMRKARDSYVHLKHYVVVVQRRYRALKSMQKERLRFLTLKRAVLCVEERYIALRLMRQQHENYQNVKMAAVVIQRWYRALCAMKRERERFVCLKRAVVAVQRRYRMKRERAAILFKLRLILNIQRYARGFLVRSKIDLSSREKVQRLKEKRRKEAAATKIQSHWRGYITRKSNPQLTKIRKRSAIAAQNAAPHKTLGHLRVQALQTLDNDDASISEILLALEDLDFITRRCKTTCKTLCEKLAEQVYVTMCATGRSLPEMKVCTLAASILINFCKYPVTTERAWFPEYVGDILTLMVNWCDKEYVLFCHLCTLLWLFAHRKQCKEYMLKVPNVRQKLEKMRGLIMRKRNMVMRARTAAGVTLFLGSNSLPLPSLKPDWGLDLKHAPRTFTNTVHAFESLIRILNVDF